MLAILPADPVKLSLRDRRLVVAAAAGDDVVVRHHLHPWVLLSDHASLRVGRDVQHRRAAGGEGAADGGTDLRRLADSLTVGAVTLSNEVVPDVAKVDVDGPAN